MPFYFAADSFHTKKLCSRLSSSEVRFSMEVGRFAFLRPPLGDLAATYDDHLRLIGKRVADFLLVLIEFFSLVVTAEELWANIGSKSAISLQRRPVDPKFQVEGVAPTNHSSSQKTRLNDLSYYIKIWTDLSSILSQVTRLTDWRVDRILIARPRLRCMQRGKNGNFRAVIGRTYKIFDSKRLHVEEVGCWMRISTVRISHIWIISTRKSICCCFCTRAMEITMW